LRTFVLGLGRYAEEITDVVSRISEVIVVEKDEGKISGFLREEKRREINLIKGNATDITLWRKIGPSREDAIISFLGEDITLDIARVLRKVFNFKGTFLFISKGDHEEKSFKELEIEVISVPDMLGAVIRNLIKGRGIVRYPVGIGKRKGEIAEVLITQDSPASYMRLSQLRQRGARIVLIYRDDEVILPRTDIRLYPGDRIIVAGQPRKVELLVGSILGGSSNFPLRWGTVGLLCDVKNHEQELEYLKERLKVREWKECKEFRSYEDAGILIEKASGSAVDRAFSDLKAPSLMLRGTHPYESVLISANTDALGFLLPNAVDFARLFGSKVYVLFVTSVDKMMSREEKEALESLKSFVDRAKLSSGLEINLIRKEGNPVRETLKLLRGKFNLLALGYIPGKRSSFFNPYTPHILAKKSPLTTLLVPEVNFER